MTARTATASRPLTENTTDQDTTDQDTGEPDQAAGG